MDEVPPTSPATDAVIDENNHPPSPTDRRQMVRDREVLSQRIELHREQEEQRETTNALSNDSSLQPAIVRPFRSPSRNNTPSVPFKMDKERDGLGQLTRKDAARKSTNSMNDNSGFIEVSETSKHFAENKSEQHHQIDDKREDEHERGELGETIENEVNEMDDEAFLPETLTVPTNKISNEHDRKQQSETDENDKPRDNSFIFNGDDDMEDELGDQEGDEREESEDDTPNETSARRNRVRFREPEAVPDNISEEVNALDLGSDDENNLATRGRCIKEAEKVFNMTDDFQEDFIDFCKETTMILARLLLCYDSSPETNNLDREHSSEHWSRDRMTREEHENRFTRWDAALASAVMHSSFAEHQLFKNNAFCLQDINNKSKYCAGRAIKFERITNEHMEISLSSFSYQQFSLRDFMERKITPEYDGILFERVLNLFKHGGGIEKYSKDMALLKSELTAQGINYGELFGDLQAALEPNYTLPKGPIYRRLLFNVAELFFYSYFQRKWMFRIYGWSNEELFKGVPFNHQGNDFQFN